MIFKNTHKNKKAFYEKIHKLNLQSFSDSLDYYKAINIFDDVTGRVAIYMDSYGKGQL